MIYTIGHSESYRNYLSDIDSPHIKLGKKGNYAGGSVWETYWEAKLHCPPGFEVFGVKAKWNVDTVPTCSGENWHDLLKDSEFFALDFLETA